jgi:hypothetical protein
MIRSFLFLVLLLFLMLPAMPVRAGATIAFGSSVGALNLTSAGVELDNRFVFEIGCFSPGFVPTAANTTEWITQWHAFPDGVAAYQTTALGAPFPADWQLNSFSGSVQILENPAPFTTGVPLYLWGFDRRTLSGKGEWILMTAPSWVCPDGQEINPAVSYAVSNASRAIVGRINQDGIEMQTSAVVLSGTPESLPDWRAWNFGAAASEPGQELAVWGNQADPDQDLLSNLIEYFLGSDPLAPDAGDPLSAPQPDAGGLVLHYRRSSLAREAKGGVEWSADLRQWTQAGLEEKIISSDATSVMVEARLASPPAGAAFFRLTAVE